MEAHEFLLKHSQELSEKYPEKEVSLAYLPTDEKMVKEI